MAPPTKARGKHAQPLKRDARHKKREQQQQSLESLEKAVMDFDPEATEVTKFSDLPLCQPTATGLEKSHFETLTDIQSRVIPLALKGSDILGAAKTGSGKTLAFIIPVLEKLYRARWTEYHGLGALIVSPTRELAAQIFEVLRRVGRSHAFSAGLVIGGKSLKEEAERLSRMNILVCTPGRMLQHLDQTAGFEVNNLEILVLDEADRIMDMGFQTAVDALLEHLPKKRQTMLFSATQSKKVSELGRLKLEDPKYIAVHEEATPANLQQHYIVTPLPEKLDTLYGFIKANLKSKMIVFLSSGKQVRFVYESFRHLSPGIPLLHLLGKQKQLQRMEITRRFADANHSCLFATDVVARGVDFPAVDWVVQVDCPEDADTYIHRVGRTARYERNGKAVLFLDPTEEKGMLKKLEGKKVPIQKITVKENKKRSVKNQLQSMCFQYPDVKYLGQKAFISYARSVYQQRDKDVFHFDKLDLDGYAHSLGLPGTPQIKYRKGGDIKQLKNAPRAGMSSDESDEEGEGTKSKKNKKDEVRTKYDRMFERTNQDVLSGHYNKLLDDETTGGEGTAVNRDESSKAGGSPANHNDKDGGDGDDDDDDFLSVKRVLKGNDLDSNAQGDEDDDGPPGANLKTIKYGDQEFIIDSKRREKALKSKKKMLKFKDKGTKLVFDDDGVARPLYELQDEEAFAQDGPAEEQRAKFVDDEAARVKEADLDDRLAAKERRRERKLKRKAREAEERGDMPRAGRTVALANGSQAREGGDESDDDENDPLALLRSLPTRDNDQVGHSDDDDDNNKRDTPAEEERPRKKARKWFQKDDSDDDEAAQRKKAKKSGRKVLEIDHEPESLEDLEALATGLLDE